MWYFAWILGLPLAALFAVVNAMWLEIQQDRQMMEDEAVPPVKQ
ncbi:cytochrome bd-I oxidase subunit CydX [Hoeflea sp. WL0058]|uniref:Cytochrome bd-I oxidase subunit CydX n=1 Tax=Flavimaribacter sediminis TaxID=2865987 RepID=A0AAE3CZN0_9HYPH|nr:cytochrome bd-I oxidase subunit CydX [Flavimaribacter sediminis]MBW8637505.1 cytochrome bd-I oxidase subunit CydX [Flavimaribacter sediminis]